MPLVKVVGVVAGAASAIIDCSTSIGAGSISPTCVMSAVSGALGISPSAAKLLFSKVSKSSLDSLSSFASGFGLNFDIAGLIASWGFYLA